MTIIDAILLECLIDLCTFHILNKRVLLYLYIFHVIVILDVLTAIEDNGK